MPIGRITGPVDFLAVLIDRGGLTNVITVLVQTVDIIGDVVAVRVVPRAVTNTITRINRSRSPARRLAEVGSPSCVASADSRRQLLRMSVRSR